MLVDNEGFVLTGFGNNGASGFSLVRADTSGAVQWQHNYPGPAPASFGYPAQVIRTGRGGYLLTGAASNALSNYNVYVVETDSLGRLRRRRRVVLRDTLQVEVNNRLFHNAVATRDGRGYVLTGRRDSGAHSLGWVARLDTALALEWVRWLRPTAGPGARQVLMSRVREQADGSLLVLHAELGSPLLHQLTLSPQGAVRRRRSWRTGYQRVVPYDWAPLPDSSFVAVGTAGTLLPDGRSGQVAWIGRYAPARGVLAAAAPAPRPAPLQLWPNPARDAARVRPPAGARGGRWQLLDARGRAVRGGPVAGILETVPLRGLPPGLYLLRYLDAQGRSHQGRLMHE